MEKFNQKKKGRGEYQQGNIQKKVCERNRAYAREMSKKVCTFVLCTKYFLLYLRALIKALKIIQFC